MKHVALSVLAIAVFLSALQVVIARHETRKLFLEISELERESDYLNEEWNRLQLEQSTWVTNARIEAIAKNEMQMFAPEAPVLVLLPLAQPTDQ